MSSVASLSHYLGAVAESAARNKELERHQKVLEAKHAAALDEVVAEMERAKAYFEKRLIQSEEGTTHVMDAVIERESCLSSEHSCNLQLVQQAILSHVCHTLSLSDTV